MITHHPSVDVVLATLLALGGVALAAYSFPFVSIPAFLFFLTGLSCLIVGIRWTRRAIRSTSRTDRSL
jgi:hypothetical protein